jgi:cation:H+ antiporter
MYAVLILSISLVFILISSLFFCNALENLGYKLKISDGVTGSIFAAIGTALPETMIPIIAILTSHSNAVNHEIGVGAILGAPLMLSTLTLFVVAFLLIKKRGLNGTLKPDTSVIKRDLKFFFIGYAIALFAVVLHKYYNHEFIHILLSIILGICYFIYLLLSFKYSVNNNDQDNIKVNKLILSYLGLGCNNVTIVFQLILSLLMLTYFAGMFIDNINNLVTWYNFSPFLLSLIIIPIATELPEKINSIIWSKNGKDTLAIANITGAMVFQSTLLPIIGILFTDWGFINLTHMVGIFITIIASFWMYYNIDNLKLKYLFVNGLLYLINLSFCIYIFIGK